MALGKVHLLTASRDNIRETACGIAGLADTVSKYEIINFIGDRRYEVTDNPAKADCGRCRRAASRSTPTADSAPGPRPSSR